MANLQYTGFREIMDRDVLDLQCITKGVNAKSKKGRVVILVHDTSSGPVLHFYQVSSKYSKGYSSYRVDKKFYADAEANGIRPKNNMSPLPSLVCVGGGGGERHNKAATK